MLNDTTHLFSHYLITRMNIKWKYPTHVAHICRNDAWLENRLVLFRRFCFPSVTNQTCKKFTWLLYFDTDTPESVRREIEQLIAATSKDVVILLRYVADYDAMIDDVNFVVATYSPGHKILTTRIDNDDAFHPDAIAVIQKTVARRIEQCGEEVFVVNLSVGWDIALNDTCSLQQVQLFQSAIPVNMFTSLLESDVGGQIRTVYFCMHNELDKQGFPVINVKGRPYWLRVIHGSNIANAVGFGRPLINARGVREVAIDWTDLSVDLATIPRNYGRWSKSLIGRYVRITLSWCKHCSST